MPLCSNEGAGLNCQGNAVGHNDVVGQNIDLITGPTLTFRQHGGINLDRSGGGDDGDTVAQSGHINEFRHLRLGGGGQPEGGQDGEEKFVFHSFGFFV